MATENIEFDEVSIFDYDDSETFSETFSLYHLKKAVSDHFRTRCTLLKIAQGGYHKVYDVIGGPDSTNLDAVVRVAASAFPRDKMLSEIATLKYIATFTSIPVPEVYAWNTDMSNPVGAEYMILKKIPGVAPDNDRWKLWPLEIKLNVVKQVAEHLATLFFLRFNQAGSLYPPAEDSPLEFTVGPIVSLPFYRMVDGVIEYPDMPSEIRDKLNSLRGPFNTTSEYLTSQLKAELLKIDHCRPAALAYVESEDPATTLEKGQQVMQQAVKLCHSYPGDITIPSSIISPNQPYTLMLDDLRLPNMLIDESTGRINGYIDFEGTTVVPLWRSATVPEWLPDPDSSMAGWYGGTPDDQKMLWSTFHSTIDRYDHALTGGEWRKAYELGEPFRNFAGRLGLGISFWAEYMESWIQERIEWAEKYPGIGMPEED